MASSHGLRTQQQSSVTWSSSSTDGGATPSDGDEVEDRGDFVLEYNRLAKKHGVRIMVTADQKSAAVSV